MKACLLSDHLHHFFFLQCENLLPFADKSLFLLPQGCQHEQHHQATRGCVQELSLLGRAVSVFARVRFATTSYGRVKVEGGWGNSAEKSCEQRKQLCLKKK